MEHTNTIRHRSQAVLGALIIAFGVLALLNNFDYFPLGPIWRFWPFLIVALGVSKLTSDGRRDRSYDGLWLIFIGLWLFVSINHVYGLGFHDTWPLLLIAWGCSMIWRAVDQPRRFNPLQEESHGI